MKFNVIMQLIAFRNTEGYINQNDYFNSTGLIMSDNFLGYFRSN